MNGIVYVAEKIILKLYGQEASRSDIKCHGEHLASCRLRLACLPLSTACYLSIHAFVHGHDKKGSN